MHKHPAHPWYPKAVFLASKPLDLWLSGFKIAALAAPPTFSGKKHIVTDPLNLEAGVKLEGDMFPAVSNLNT